LDTSDERIKDLIKKWKKDEKEHHTTLKNLVGKTFFRIAEFDVSTLFEKVQKSWKRDTGDINERESKYYKENK